MEIRGKKVVVLYLEDWQRRMIKDVYGQDCITWDFPIGNGGGVRYGMGTPGDPRVKRMYFTGWQKREIKGETGEDCDYIELTPGTVVKYGMPPKGIGG